MLGIRLLRPWCFFLEQSFYLVTFVVFCTHVAWLHKAPKYYCPQRSWILHTTGQSLQINVEFFAIMHI